MDLRRFEHRIPPPLVMVALAVGMAALRHLGPELGLIPELRWGGIAVCALVFWIGPVGVWQFRRAKTSGSPTQISRASTLVTGGVYRLTRNPMYLALLCALSGWALTLGTLGVWAGPLLFVAWITRLQIIPEERFLRETFGADYAAYQAKVRRWI